MRFTAPVLRMHAHERLFPGAFIECVGPVMATPHALLQLADIVLVWTIPDLDTLSQCGDLVAELGDDLRRGTASVPMRRRLGLAWILLVTGLVIPYLVDRDGVSTVFAREEEPQGIEQIGHLADLFEDPVEAFFLQVQGSGRVQLQDGSFVRLGYAANNGHPYRALSRWLVEYAKIKPSQMSMQRIQRWAKDHPGRVNELLSYNRNYVFFMERFGFSDDEGPIGSQGVCLTPGASVAVDRSYWSMGLPFVVDVTQENPDLSFCKPVLAQDTGGAIRGVLRFDHFWGYGPEAGESAGKQKSEVRAWVLSPKGYTPWDLD